MYFLICFKFIFLESVLKWVICGRLFQNIECTTGFQLFEMLRKMICLFLLYELQTKNSLNKQFNLLLWDNFSFNEYKIWYNRFMHYLKDYLSHWINIFSFEKKSFKMLKLFQLALYLIKLRKNFPKRNCLTMNVKF